MNLRYFLALAVIALFALSKGAIADPTPAPIAGDWRGVLNAGGATLRIVFHFVAKSDGSVTATFDSVDQGANGIPFSSASVNGASVHLEAQRIGGSFSGSLDATGTKLTGEWRQGGADLPLTMTRIVDEKPSSASDAALPPMPYLVKDVTFPGGASNVILAGTLTLPRGDGPFPATVLICGSGPHDRDETILAHKPFALLADTLTRRGIAVLRYDKRGIAKSTGDYANATTVDFAHDAQAAVAFLETQPSIDAQRIGLLGHSEGGLIAPMVASKNKSIAFVVLMAGPGLTGENILLAQGALIGRADGAPAASVAKNTALQKQLFAIVRSQPDNKIAQAQCEAAVMKRLGSMTPDEKKEMGDATAAFAKAQSAAVCSPWFRYFLTSDPIPALKATHCPVLALDGSLDLQVPPKEDLAAISAALTAGGNTKSTVTELPGLNHLFQTCKTGSPSEYATIKETIAPIALTTIGDWIVAQTKAAP